MNTKKKCHKCGKHKSLGEFAKNKTRPDGLQGTCKTCKKTYNKKHYQDNKNAYKSRAAQRRIDIRRWMLSVKETLCCNRCPENHIACLQFHHIDPSQKEMGIAQMVNQCWSVGKIQSEMDKCEVLCANCHAKEHYLGDAESTGYN